MVRRIVSQVHKQVARLMRAGCLKHEPAYKVVLDYPPLALPPKAPPSRGSYDIRQTPRHPSQNAASRDHGLCQYIEDDIRRQFSRDHPFETYEPVTLVESAGVEDTRPSPLASLVRVRLPVNWTGSSVGEVVVDGGRDGVESEAHWSLQSLGPVVTVC
jgi:small subunit ribosomal protein S23